MGELEGEKGGGGGGGRDRGVEGGCERGGRSR